jgi:DNA-binding NarL/FixJ family response regulator
MDNNSLVDPQVTQMRLMSPEHRRGEVVMSERGIERGGRLITVALVNDYELVLRGLVAMLAPYRSLLSVIELAIDTEPESAVDVALFDSYGHVQLGLDRVTALAATPHVASVAVYTSFATSTQRDMALEAGARGVLSKALSAEELADALVAIARGEEVISDDFSQGPRTGWPGSELGLTARESEVAALLMQGMSNKDIAQALWISQNTVKSHLKAIFDKTDARSRSQAIMRIVENETFIRRRPA